MAISFVPGVRKIENTDALVEDTRRRIGERLLNPMTSDDYPAYEAAILHAHGKTVMPPPTRKPGRPVALYNVPPEGLNNAVVTKGRKRGLVVEFGTRVGFGTAASVMPVLDLSRVSCSIKTAFIERENGADRHRNAREARKTYRFSKDWRYHEAVTYLSLYSYNFCWPVRTLTVTDCEGDRQGRSPAMAKGLTNHVWSMAEWLLQSAVLHC